MLPPDERLLVFLKVPRPGAVKTRLAATMGEAAALESYRRILSTTLERIADRTSVELRFSPEDGAPEVAQWLRPSWSAAPQGTGDLGQRLDRAFTEAFREGFRRVAVIGSDSPDLTSADVTTAFEALDRSDVVLGPAEDGGYWLLAVRRPCPFLFRGIPWSTPGVLEETRRKAESAGLKVERLRTLSDIDTEADWRRWIGQGNPGSDPVVPAAEPASGKLSSPSTSPLGIAVG